MNIRHALTAAFGIAALATGGLLAAPVDSNDVARAIGNWRHRRGTLGAKLGETVRDVRRVECRGVAFHVVRFAGGGHLIAPADTKIRPVMMFSEGDDFDLDENNPALALIAADIGREAARADANESAGTLRLRLAAAPSSPNEREWEELLGEAPDYAYTSSLDDVRVEPIVKTKWAQSNVGNTWCYNYSTPNHYPCGCVATALAQIMKYFEWPKGNVEQWTSTWTSVDSVAKNLTTQGGTFDWANMPEVPSSGMSDVQRQAIGKLTSDVGILLGMSYASGGSGTYSKLGWYALTQTVLGYSNAMLAVWPNSADFRHGTEADFRRAMISNFNAKRPVMLGIEGHSIVGDGYGYDRNGTLYYHLNFGWSGSSDYWYSTPVNGDNKIGGSYTCFSAIVYNIYTEEDASLVILSGRVTDKLNGRAVSGQSVTAYAADGTSAGVATTDARGIYSMLVSPGTYTVAAFKESQDRRSAYSGSAQGEALRCVTLENTGRSSHDALYGPLELGNCADCDIAMETVEYEPEAEVSVGEVSVLTNFTMATVPVTAKVVHYGPTATGAKVAVTLTPVSNGAGQGVPQAQTREFAIGGDFDAHAFDAVFEGLEAGGRYVVTARVVMDDADGCVDDGAFTAAKEFAWFNEKATSFSAAKWTGDPVKVQDGCLSVFTSEGSVTTFTPERKTISGSRIVLRIRESGCYLQGELPNPDGPVAVSVIAQSNGKAELVVWDSETWKPTGIQVEEDAVNLDVAIDFDILRHRVQYGVGGKTFGPYALPDSFNAISEVVFKGYVVLSELAGTASDANLVADAAGNEYATFADAMAAGASGVLSPLWFSTWNLAGGSGTVDVKDPDGFVTFTGEPKVIKSEPHSDDGFVRMWYAEANAADVAAGAEQYVKTTVALGLAKAITTNSVAKIDDFAVVEGAMTFKVAIDDVEVAKAAINDLVEVSGDLGAWKKPEEAGADITFDPATHVITVTPPAGPCGFVRVKIPAN